MKAQDGKRPEPKGNGQAPSDEYKRFERLTKRLLQVPKKAIKEQGKKRAR
jgi:hypothetical protein